MAKEVQPSVKQDGPPAGGGSLLARLARGLAAFPAWALANRLRAALVLSAAVVAVIGALAGLTLAFRSPDRPAYQRQLGQALAQLDAGILGEARRLAADLLADPTVSYEDQGGPYYILGAATAREAEEQANPARRRLLNLVASRYLEESRHRGIPQPREKDALLLLGRVLHDAGRFDRSIAMLHDALLGAVGGNPQIETLLADDYLKLKPPRLQDALEHIRQYLSSAALSQAEQDSGHLTEASILLAQSNLAAALEAVGQVPPTAPLYGEAVVLRGRILLESFRQGGADVLADKASQFSALLEELRGLLSRGSLPPATAAQAQLLVGLAESQQGNKEQATAQFDRTRRAFFGQPEGVAAMVFLANSIRTARPLEAIALYKRALMQAGSAENYDNLWLPVEQFQRFIETAIDELAAGEQFSGALDLATALAPFFPRAISAARQVEIHRNWARRLEERGRKEKPPQAGVTEAEARREWREAGATGRQLAELRIATRFYLDDLAKAADDFRRGQGYEQAVAVYRDLLRQDPRQGQPEALVGLGESLLTLGKVDEALPILASCRDAYPTHPITYRGRLLAGLALAERGQLAEAKELLIDNLYRYSLAPQSSDWRDSLFALGTLLYREALELESRSRLAGVDRPDAESRKAGLALLEQSHASFNEAVRVLGEAVQRYPAAPESMEARYRIAEAHRHSAKWPRKRRGEVTIVTSRASLERQMQEQLLAAVNEYNSLITRLSEPTEVGRGPADAAILRNCYFGRADALFDLERYDEAIDAYSAATNRYQHDPESLEAYVRIAGCYRRLNRLSEARGTIDQARVVFQRIRPDADFAKTTRLARADWVALLDWLRTL